MLSSLLRPSQRRRPRAKSVFASWYEGSNPGAENTDRERSPFRRSFWKNHNDVESSNDENTQEQEGEENREGSEADDEDGSQDPDSDDEEVEENSPLLPLFSSTELDTLPVFTLTHTFRLLVVSKCDTVLTWDQLRSPQVSQFLLKPIQQEIRNQDFNPATLCALLANCLQFTKEANLHPGNSGTSKTRAMLCELIAIKLLREYSTGGLIDALSYDFDPLQGQAEPPVLVVEPDAPRRGWQTSKKPQPRSARITSIEIAIRTQAKRFLAHPLVVQHLEAIWNGTIVFHAAADSFHRGTPPVRPLANYGTNGRATAANHVQPARLPRTVTLYNPRDASLFKLSRLRVPRYRNILSTVSFAVLLALFLAVLLQRSVHITTLEVVFWFWAAGYMLDEVIGFNEQGFSLYIASFWNTFDVGILILLFVHLCLRLYGIIMPDVRKHTMAYRAYDILAADAILLFPRLFSLLDHYRYFSQLIIAFRMMAADMIAIFVLIIIFCSGFFVALSLAFGNDAIDSPSDVAYALLQMLMGFTPAAWDRWDSYNWLGKSILTLFLFICHFVVVTILITVLTNSFMEIVRNANEEHQFLFAINTISNVKSDALFAYVAPANVLQWALTPLRYVLPFKTYVKLNRTIIKMTHFPVLLAIYLYERLILRSSVVDSIDLIDNKTRRHKNFARRLPRLMREPSTATFRQEAALEQVFKTPVDATLRTDPNPEGRKSSNVVSTWMNSMVEDAVDPPQEQDRRIVDKLERRRMLPNSPGSRLRHVSGRTMSVVSDPAEAVSHMSFFSPRSRMISGGLPTPPALGLPLRHGDGDDDGDDELNEEDEDKVTINASELRDDAATEPEGQPQQSSDYFSVRPGSGTRTPDGPTSMRHRVPSAKPRPDSSYPSSGTEMKPRSHLRNVSSATMIYRPSPAQDTAPPSPKVAGEKREATTSAGSVTGTGTGTRSPPSKTASHTAGRRTPKRAGPTRLRPGLPDQSNRAFRSSPNLAVTMGRAERPERSGKQRSKIEMDLVSDIGDNKAIGGGYVGAIPASFASQMAHAMDESRQAKQRKDETEMFGRLMMARMNSLEEGFRDVIYEMRESVKQGSSRNRSPEKVVRIARDKKAKDRDGRRGDKMDGFKGTGSGSSGASAFNQPFGTNTPAVGTSAKPDHRGAADLSKLSAQLAAVESSDAQEHEHEHEHEQIENNGEQPEQPEQDVAGFVRKTQEEEGEKGDDDDV